MTRVYVWDLPVRLLHVLLIAGVISAYVSYECDYMTWHFYNGYMMLTVVALRVLWGFFGNANARFSNFIKSPRVVLNYIRTWHAQAIGTTHNPLGGYAVLALLGAIAFQGLTGLFSNDEALAYGPLYDYVGLDISEFITEIHETTFFLVLLPMIAIHIAAIFIYWRFKKINLVTPMITGYKND